jgi:hypothetical protein
MKKVVLLAAVITLAAAACTPSVPSAQSAFCESAAAFGTSLQTLKALGPTSTVDEAQAAVKGVEEAWTAMVASAQTLDQAKWAAVQESYETMMSDIRSVSDESTLIAAKASMEAAAIDFEASLEEIKSSNCANATP